MIAIIVLGGGIYALYYNEPNILAIITWRELVITALAVLVFGLVITLTCSYISVNRFLRMPAGELYKI
jgi:cell division transport system permease protein